MTRATGIFMLLALAACSADASDAGGPAAPSGPGAGDGGSSAPDATTALDAGDGGGVAPSSDAAAPGDGSPSDAGADAAPPACKALFCEDFESGKLDPARWETNVGYDPANAVTVQTTKAAHGGHAALAHIANAGGGFAYIRAKSPFPQLASGMWGRAYVFHTIDATVGHNALVKAESPAGDVLEVGQGGGKVQLTFYPPSGEKPVGYPTAIPRGTWTCMEWHMAKASPQIELFVDGTSIATYAYSGAEVVPAFTSVKLGIETHSANTSTDDVYLDDIAIDGARIGCLP
jgi:hypothetical protein